MATLETRYLPTDRLRALTVGASLPTTVDGSALFADISGFTPITERLRQLLGARRGAETLATHLNRVYDALIAQVERYGGAIISFAGDAITCWFEGDDAPWVATDCAFALLDTLQFIEQIALPDGETASIGIKVSIATGRARRFVVGDPEIQLIDALAGATVARMTAGEGEAERGEVVVDKATATRLGSTAHIREWRERDGERFAVLERARASSIPPVVSQLETDLDDTALRPWLLPAVTGQFQVGLGEYLTELRPAVALFIRFSGIEYDRDPEAEAKLDRFIRLAQRVVARYEGSVLQLTMGDKGSYLYSTFGAPFAHEDDVARALDAALDLRTEAADLGYLDPVQIGISRGIMRTGAYGSETRRTYGVLGDEVNLAARLMARAAPGEILVSETLLGARLDGFALEALPPIQVKGKANLVGLFRLVERRERTFEARFYTTPLVGRENELATVQMALHPIFETRHAGIIFVYGEAGMGKSRLAFEAQTRLQTEAPVTWLIGQADALNRASLSAFAYFLRPYFGQRRERDTAANLTAFEAAFDRLLALSDEANRADLLLYRSYLAGVVGLSISGSPYEAADAKSKIDNQIPAIKAWVRAEARRQPLVVHLEDAQWLDADSIRTVQQLTYNMETVPVALLLTSRYNDDGTPYAIPNIYSIPIHTLNLNHLSDEGVRSVAGAILGGELSDALARFVRERAEGNPFFTEQLALDLKEREALIQTEGVWNLRPNAESEVPSGVNAVLIARLDRLAAQVKAVVQTAAVLGREFDVQILSRMLREGEQVYIQVAEEEAIWSALDALRYLFRHALLRDAAYQMQVQDRLKTLHRLAAETIEVLYPDDRTQDDVLLEHWHNAQVANKILAYTVPVCERLIELTGDYPRAERLLQQALTLGETPVRATLLRLLGDAVLRRAQYPEAVGYYETCLNVTGEDTPQRIQALDGLGRISMAQGDYAKAADWVGQALALSHQHQDQLGVAHAQTTLGDIAYSQADHPTAVTHYKESLRLYRALDVQTGVIDILTNLGKVATLRGEHTQARVYLEECLTFSQALGARDRIATSLSTLGNLSLLLGDYGAGHRYYESCLSIRREIGDRKGVAGTLANLAIVALETGNIAEAYTYGEASLRERRALNSPMGIAHSLGILATVAIYRIDYDAAQRAWEESMQIQRSINDRWGLATTLCNLGGLARMKGQYAEAQRYAEESLILSRQLEQPWNIATALVDLGLTAYEQREWAKARGFYNKALTIQQDIDNQVDVANTLIYLGDLDAQTGALDDAERRIEEGLVILRALGERKLSSTLVLLAGVKQKMGLPLETIHPLLREALTVVQLQEDPMAKQETLIAAAPILLADSQYNPLAELIGLLLTQTISYKERADLDTLLEELRPHLEAADLDAALERGRALDVDAMIAALLAELEQN